MKNFKLLLMLSVIFCIFNAGICDPDKPNTLSVSPASLTFTAVNPDDQTVTISTDATSWAYQATADWVRASQNGNSLTISANNYDNTKDQRNAVITITAGDAPAVTISITQSPKIQDNLSLSPTSLTFEANETGTKSVVVTTDAASWNASPSASWVTVAKSGNNAIVSVSNNSTSSDRSATVTITAGDADSKSFTVTQRRPNNTLSLDKSALNFAYNSTTAQTITITTNASEWSVTHPTSVDTWLSVTINGKVVTVRPKSPNSSTSARTAILTFEAGNARPIDVTVTQNPRPEQENQQPQVRFRKTSNNSSLYEMAVVNTSFEELAYHQFNTSTGTSSYTSIPAGRHHVLINEGGEVYVITFSGTNTYNFQSSHRYTFEYNGSDYTMWDEGTFSGISEQFAAPSMSPSEPSAIGIRVKKLDAKDLKSLMK